MKKLFMTLVLCAAAPSMEMPDADLMTPDEVHKIASYGRFVTVVPICGLRDGLWAKFLEERIRGRLMARFEHENGLRLLARFEARGTYEVRTDHAATCAWIGIPWLLKEADEIVLGAWPKD